MARYGVNILKRCSFRGGTQHFGNTYYYEVNISASSLSALETMLDELVAKEKAMHATDVTFVRGRVWSQVGTPSQNNMLVDKALSGTGALTTSTTMDRERAFLVRFRAGVDSRGRPVYLRKWWHLMAGSIAGSGITNDQLKQVEELNSTQRSALETFANSMKTFTTGGQTANLVAKGGRGIDGATAAHRYLEHHQLGDEWRGV
jgi:hypothetical protein